MLTMARIDRPNEQTNIDLFTFRKAKSENTCCRTVVEIDRAGHRYDKANFALRLRDYRICGQSVYLGWIYRCEIRNRLSRLISTSPFRMKGGTNRLRPRLNFRGWDKNNGGLSEP